MDANRYTVSVIIPTYNRAEFLKYVSLPSVVRQTRPALESIIVDDGSTDDTAAVVKDFMMKYPGAGISYIFQENTGVAAARNTGITRARGEWILALDSDDAMLDDALETLTEAAIKESADIVRGRTWRVKLKTGKIRGIGESTPSSVLLNKKIFTDYGLYDEDRNIIEDVDHVMRLRAPIRNGVLIVPYLKTPTAVYFSHDEQVTNLGTASRLAIKAAAMIKKWEPLVPKTEQGRSDLARLWRNKGVYEILSGLRSEGIRSLSASLKLRRSVGTVLLYACGFFGKGVISWVILPVRNFTETILFHLRRTLFVTTDYRRAEKNIKEVKRIAEEAKAVWKERNR